MHCEVVGLVSLFKAGKIANEVTTTDTHLHLAKSFYVAMAKGAINDCHLLLSPVKHIANQLSLDVPSAQELVK